MTINLGSFSLQLYTIIALFLLVTLTFRVRNKSLPNFFSWSSSDDPILIDQGLFSAPSTQSMAQGQVAGFYYNLLTNNSGQVTVLINLDRPSSTHVLAFGDKSNSMAATMPRKWLRPVQLEGDFPSYFHLYCTPGKEIELLQVFDPETMAHFADFCRAYNLEIYKESIYITQAGGARDKQDTTTLFTDIEAFLSENKLVLTRM